MPRTLPSSQQAAARWRPFFGNLLIIVFVAATGFFFLHQSRTHYEQQARTSTDDLTQLLGRQVGSVIEKTDLALNAIAWEIERQQAQGGIQPDALKLFLARHMPFLPDVNGLRVTDEKGWIRYGTDVPLDTQVNISDRNYFGQLREAPTGELAIDGPYLGKVSRRWVLVVARRFNHPDGSFAGTVSAGIDVARFREMLSGLTVGKHGLVALRTADMRLVASASQMQQPGNIDEKAIPVELQEGLRAHPDYGVEAIQSRQGEGTLVYRKLPGWPLYVIIGLAASDYLAPWWGEVIELAAILIIFTLVTLWLSADAIRAARKEQATSRLFQESMEHAALGLSIFDPQQRLVLCNETSHGIFPDLHDVLKPGVKLDYIMRTGVLRGLYPEALENPEHWIGERVKFHQLANGQPFEQKLRDGRQLLIIENRTPSGHIVSSRIDITELSQYRLELEHMVATRTAELKAALDQFRILVELSPTGLAMLDRDFNYLAVSRRWIELDDKGHRHLVGKHLYDVTPDLPERWKAIHRAALTGVMDSREEDLWVRADGRECWVRWVVHPWIDSVGQVGGIIISIDDITDRKRAEERLLKNEARFRSIFEQAAVGLAYLSPEGEFQQVNDKYGAIVGYGLEELLGRKAQDIIHPDDLGQVLEDNARLLAGSLSNHTHELRSLRKDGTQVWTNVTISLVRTAAGEPDYFLEVMKDIQPRKDAELALAIERKARQTILEQQVAERTAELQAANQQLEGFVYASSHDLRGPLGRISSFCTLLENNYRDRLEGNGLLFLDFIRDNALRLTRLVDDLLTHAHVDQLVAALQPINVQAAIQMAIWEKEEDIRGSGTIVRVSLPPVEVLADPYGLSQVMRNLLENAIKYSAESANPAIEIGGEPVGERFRLWVRDNGIGFDMEYHDKIFEIFRRLHTHSEYVGSGVGLALVKRAMERMGGHVWAESETGNGATFYLEFGMASVPAMAS